MLGFFSYDFKETGIKQSEQRSVFSLKLTDAALSDIQEYIKDGKANDLTIRFRKPDNAGQCQKVYNLETAAQIYFFDFCLYLTL